MSGEPTDVPDGLSVWAPPAGSWRETELGIVGGAAHALNSSLTGLTLAAGMARMDAGMTDQALEVIEQQAVRLQQEVQVLFSLLSLERSDPQLHNPIELARAAARLFDRLPAATRSSARITGTREAGAVEVPAGPCIRAIILCMLAFAGAAQRLGTHEIELFVHGVDNGVGLEVRCDDAAVEPLAGSLEAAAAVLRPHPSARLETHNGRVRLIMPVPDS